jgi:hypothetical protein
VKILIPVPGDEFVLSKDWEFSIPSDGHHKRATRAAAKKLGAKIIIKTSELNLDYESINIESRSSTTAVKVSVPAASTIKFGQILIESGPHCSARGYKSRQEVTVSINCPAGVVVKHAPDFKATKHAVVKITNIRVLLSEINSLEGFFEHAGAAVGAAVGGAA